MKNTTLAVLCGCSFTILPALRSAADVPPPPPPAPKPAAPAARVDDATALHPILIAPGRILGWVANGRWVASDQIPQSYKGKPVPTDCEGKKRRIDMGGIKGGETFRLFTSQAALGTGKGSRVSHHCDGAGNVYYDIDIKPDDKQGKSWRWAVNGDWNALPRAAKKGKQAWQIDLDGDGVDETVKVTSKPPKDKDSEAKEVQTFTLKMKGKSLTLAQVEMGGDYGTSQVDVDFADLNGDGILEIILSQSGFGASVRVMDVSGGELKQVAGYSDSAD